MLRILISPADRRILSFIHSFIICSYT